ncbi:MAG TPA: HU family DNA-binding protein [Bryobacteraceae bacterium]|nr:HU family DNA-binding protein [Bryobacteraceae bacterium]
MNKPDIAKRIARQTGVTEAEAADGLDRVVRQILTNLRKGKETSFPGLGKFVGAPGGKVSFEPEGRKRGGKRG